MEATKTFNHNFATIGWGLLLIWWGVCFMVGPITIGMCAVGTGLIFLGVNAARMVKGIPTNRSTTIWGLVLVVWGALDHLLALSFEASFAVLLIVIGLAIFSNLVVRTKDE